MENEEKKELNDIELQELMEEIKPEDENLNQFLDVVLKNRDRVSLLESLLKIAKGTKMLAERELISAMVNNQLESMKSGKITVSHREVTTSSVNKIDREIQHEWLRESGFGDLIKESVNAKTFSSFMNKEYEGEIPEFVKQFTERKLFVRGAK